MLNILFVDDDAIARRSMIHKIDWAAYGWKLIYTAKDAVDALDFMKQTQPDIILSDIKMPIMDGIQMALIARNYYPDIKYIFLSGYKEFEYAKQALRLNAVDYLNKPVEAGQLISVLKEAETLCRQDQERNRILREQYPSMQRQFLSQLMQKHFRETDDSAFEALGLKLSNGFGAAGILEADQPSQFKSYPLNLSSVMDRLCRHLYRHFPDSLLFTSYSAESDNSTKTIDPAHPKTLQIFFLFTLCDLSAEADFQCGLNHLKSLAQEFWQKNCPEAPPLRFHFGTAVRKFKELSISYESLLQAVYTDASDLLKQVKAYIQKNYANEDLTLTQIADHFYLNHCYLTSIFKERYGINLYDYLIQTRMEKAGELAVSSDQKVYEIAAAAGYKNSQYFSVSFKKYYGCTVMEYRQKKGHLAQDTD